MNHHSGAWPKIGFVGMGLMGVPMSLRLLQAGYHVQVWNRSINKTKLPVAQGAKLAKSAAALVEDSDVIMLCLTDTAAVEQVMFGEQGVAPFGADDKVLVDFSSIAPDATQRFSERLQAISGMAWVDAPVSGGVSGAETGELVIMAGGDQATINGIRPLLGALSQRVTHMGPVGSGQATKVCNQMIVSCNVMVMAEVLALAEKTGVDATKIPAALKGGFADSTPLQLTGTRMAEKDFNDIKWHVKTLLKDLDLSSDLAAAHAAETPMAALARTLMKQHRDNGFADKDPSTLIQLYLQD